MLEKILYGRKKPMTLPNGEKRTTQYVIVDLDEIKASHNEHTFQDTEGYPLNEHGRNINDRNYKNDVAAQQTVISIAQNIDGDKLIELTSSPSGTPIIDKNGIVVSGNNRVMSLKLAANKYPDQYQKYLDVLASEVESFGFKYTVGSALLMHDRIALPDSSFDNPKSVTFSHPVLVRIDEDIPALNTTELAKYNLISKKGERPVDKAVKLGNILRENERCRNVILSVIDGYEAFSDLYSSAGRNDRKKLVQSFIDCGLIPEQQMVSYYNDGEFTDQGKDFVESVLSAMILSPDALNVAGLEGVKRLRQTIISSLPVLITNENLPDNASLQVNISQAIVIEHKIRQVGDFSDYVRSQSMFGDEDFKEKSFVINRVLDQGRNTFKEAIKKYNEAVKNNSGNALFAGEQLSLTEIFNKTIASLVSSADMRLIEQKFKNKEATSMKSPGTSIAIAPVIRKPAAVTETDENLWNNDEWFKDNPDRILGVAYATSGRFGEVTKYKGTLGDLEKIEVPDNFLGNMKAVSDPMASFTVERTPELDALNDGMKDRIEKIIEQSEKEVNIKIVRQGRQAQKNKQEKIEDETVAVKGVPELQTFEQIYKLYNQQISPEELEVFVWWKSHTDKPLSRRWINLIKPGTYSADSLYIPTPEHYTVSEDRIKHWITKGLLFYYNGRYEPEVIYLSGNVYEKRDQLERDKEIITEKFGQDIYDAQFKAFDKAYQRLFDRRLLLTGSTEDGLTVVPISTFAENFQVKRIDIMPEDGVFLLRAKKDDTNVEPDFIKDPETADKKKQIFEQLNLKYAFAYWLQRGNPELKEAISSMDIIKYYLNGHRLINKFDKVEQRIAYENEKTKIEKLKSSCQREGNRLFLLFLKNQLLDEDKLRLENEWNGMFNNHLPVDYNKIPVAFTMCKYYKGKQELLRPEKREAVAFSLVEGSACLSYDVGVGKTPSAIFTISAFMDAGFCLRPFVCVPNQVYKQFISEIKAFAPHIPVLEAYNMAEEYVKNFQDPAGNITKVPAGTITVMTYEGLERIGFSEETGTTLFMELYEILNQGGESERKQTKKQTEGFKERVESIIGKGLRGTLFNIEDFGFDFGCYDEAHKMKKIFTAVKGEVIGKTETEETRRSKNPYAINSGIPSSIGLKGFMLNYYIQKNNGWQNVLLLTATPFTNSPLEIFSVLSMIAYQKLKQTDLNSLKSFFDTYVNTSTELVINPQLRPVFKQVILGFNNLLSLQTLIRRFVNYKTGDQANVERPRKIVLPYLKKIDGDTVIDLSEEERIETYIEMTSAQKAMQEDIIAYVEGKGKLAALDEDDISDEEEDAEDKKPEESEAPEAIRETTKGVRVSIASLGKDELLGVRTIRALNWSRNLSLSPYLYAFSGMNNPTYQEYIDTSPKLKYVMECVRTVKEWHEARNEPVSGQVIYMDRGVEYFDLLKQYLVNEIGYQPHEVGIIKSGLPKNGKKSKEYIKNLFNGEIYNENTKLFDQVDDAQRIKVVIGSSTIKEGINLQRYGTVLYNCFMDWNPTDIQQLDGRIWRQGNLFAVTRHVNPLVTDSADIFLFQKLQEKTSRLNSIWATEGRKNVLNTQEFNPEELKYALIRDPKIVADLKSIEESGSVEGDIINNERLIETTAEVKKAAATINNHLEDAEKLLVGYRKYQPTASKIDNAERLVKLVIDAYTKETDIQGRKIYSRSEVDELKSKRKWDATKMIESSEGPSYSSNVGIKPFYKPYWFSDFSLAVRVYKNLYTSFLAPFKIDVTLDNLEGLEAFIKDRKQKIEELRAFQEKIKSSEHKKVLIQEVIEEREKNKIRYKSLNQAVKDFEKLNYVLGERKVPSTVRKLTSICPPMIGDERLIDDQSIVELEQCALNQPETKSLWVDENGNYRPERLGMHEKIVNDLFQNVRCIRNAKPLAIFTGGAPGSGKTSYYKKIPWLADQRGEINPNIFHIDADAIRAKLPEYKGWNATSTHKETQDIVKNILAKLGDGHCQYDFIYDGTMNTPEKYFNLIRKVKNMGYMTYVIFVEVPYSVSKKRVLERYKRRGRYVPMEVIDDFFTMLPAENKTRGQFALDQLKNVVDGYVVVDGITGNIIDQKGEDLPKQRYYDKENAFEIVPEAESRLSSQKEKELPEKTSAKPKVKKAPLPKVNKQPMASPKIQNEKPVIGKTGIKKQIGALKLAARYSDHKEIITKQITALKLAMKYAA
jgi:predicted kinase